MHFFGIPNVKNLSGQEIIRKPIGFTVQKKMWSFLWYVPQLSVHQMWRNLEMAKIRMLSRKEWSSLSYFVHVFHKIKMLVD